MARVVDLEFEYSYPPDLLWKIVTGLGHLEEVTSGLLSFRGLPKGRIAEGDLLDVEVSILGITPYQPYRMEVVSLNDRERSFQSSERGAGVKSWKHHLKVEPTEHGSRLVEQIAIDAGLMTPVFSAWARYLYKRRHKPRLAILRRLSGERRTRHLH